MEYFDDNGVDDRMYKVDRMVQQLVYDSFSFFVWYRLDVFAATAFPPPSALCARSPARFSAQDSRRNRTISV